MIALTTAVALGAMSYVATNVDNLVIVSTLCSDASKRRAAALGMLIASAVVLSLSAAGTLLDKVIEPEHLGYLGIVPLGLGLRLAISGPAPAEQEKKIGGAWAIAVLLIANSTDTIAALAPLFAESSRASRFGLLLGFAFAAVAWLVLMLMLTRSAGAVLGSSPKARRFAHYFASTTMIIVGAYIFWDTATDSL